MITKYGYDVVITVLLVVVAGVVASWYSLDFAPAKYGIIVLLLLLLVFTLNFFRDPERNIPSGENLVLSPADGTVVVVKEIHEGEYLQTDAVQVSVFMSPLNVHVNRYPINGTVGYFKHIPGEYLVAYEDKSSLRNERTHIGIENSKMKVFFKQIAGFVARRIVAPIDVGMKAVAGERFGMIKFGSRVDIFVPKGFEIKVRVGDKAVAGETIVAVAT